MAVTQINRTDNLGIQRTKINEISSNLGDVELIHADIGAEASPNTDAINSLNALYTLTKNIERSVLVRAITLG